MANVTGWGEVINGSVIAASNALYTQYYGDWTIALLVIGFKIMLYFVSNGNPFIMLVSSLIVLGLFYTLISPVVVAALVSIGILELAMSLYSIIYKK